MKAKPAIHVVDDDDAVRDSISVMLEVERFAVRSYASGAAFLSEAELDDNCCLLLDMHMPGMEGLDLLRCLRGKSLKTPAIVMTGRVDKTLRRALTALEAVLLEKPFQLRELIDCIKAATGRDDI